MNTRQAEFFFDVGSPASYLAWTQLPAICAAAGAELLLRPMLLGAVFQASGNASPITVPAKGRYIMRDFQRYARRYGVPLLINPHFPINTLVLMRGAAGLQREQPERLDAYLRCVFEAIWVHGLNMNDPAEVARVLAVAGLDAAALLALANADATKAALRASTDEAVARGVFGAPSIFVGGELFFGQDRLDWVREALAG